MERFTNRKDWSDKYNTDLRSLEPLFQQHVSEIPVLGNSIDYDSRGWWLNQMRQQGASAFRNMASDPQKSLEYMKTSVPTGDQHWTDMFKKPNHPTFSTGSIYHNADGYIGGVWTQTPKKNHVGDPIFEFYPSSTNIEMTGAQNLMDYWNKVEKPNGHIIHMPDSEIVHKSFLSPFPFAWIQREKNDLRKSETPAWQRAEGKNPKGGLNAKGRASAKAEGHNLKPPVLHAGNNLEKMKRQYSFLSRMSGNPGPEYDEDGKPTRLLLSLKVWGANSKAEAKKKAASLKHRIEAMEANKE